MATDLPRMATPPAVVIAAGEAPDWQLVRHGDRVVLRRAGLPDVTATPAAASDTPGGRETRAAIVGGGGATLTWRQSPGLCRMAAPGDTAGFVSVTLPDATILRGCMRGR